MGRLERLLITVERGQAPHDVVTVEAVAGYGLRGDRYLTGRGTFSGRPGVAPGAREISIIDAAAVALCNERLGRSLDAACFRRNLVVSGIDLRALRDRTLHIGTVRLRVVSSCPPCGYLSRLLGIDARRGLRGIGGVRAAVQVGGRLDVGMPVEAADAARV